MALQIVVGVVAVVAVLVLCGKKLSLAPQTTIFGGSWPFCFREIP